MLSHYKWDSDADVAQYASVFHTLMQRLPIEGFPAVESNLEEFFIGGVGCVGVAKDWIARAFARMLKERKGVLTMAHFRDTRLSPVQLKTMALELAHAEEWVRSAKSDNELKLLLGVKPRPSSDAQSAKGQPAKPTKSRGKPFTRRPGRDPVGGVRGAEGGAAA